MTTMQAAVVTSFGAPPRYLPFDVPRPAGSDQELVEVLRGFGPTRAVPITRARACCR
jgi:hypothetical protein